MPDFCTFFERWFHTIAGVEWITTRKRKWMKTHKKNNGLFFSERPPKRQSYMLRCVESRGLQSTENGSGAVWLFSLHDPKNGTVINFRGFECPGCVFTECLRCRLKRRGFRVESIQQIGSDAAKLFSSFFDRRYFRGITIKLFLSHPCG